MRTTPWILAAALAGLCARAAAQSPAPAPDTVPRGTLLRPLVTVGSELEQRLRDDQLRGAAPDAGWLLRSPSSLTPWSPGVAVLVPEARLAWNSRLPFSVNDGAMWAGRGGSMLATAGFAATFRHLRLVVAPELAWSENRSLSDVVPASFDTLTRPFQPPWLTGRNSADLPYRFGASSFARLYPGESSLTLRAGGVEAGGSTEEEWWGPGGRFAIVLTNDAPGFPHLFLRTAHPLRTPLGGVEARWITGALESSEWFAVDSAGGEAPRTWRSLSAASLVLHPAGVRGLSLGVSRSVYADASGAGNALSRGADVLTRWSGAGDTARARPYEQMLSLSARWVLPADGAELYAEWARYRLPTSLRDFLEAPEHTQGYVLGGSWLRPAGPGAVRLNAELTFLERSPTYATRPIGSWYASAAVPEGYTNQGEPLGAFVGPGASGQWASADWLRAAGRVGLFLGRVRWANDAYYDYPYRTSLYFGHDVSVYGGVRGATTVGPFSLAADYTLQRRYNVFFQNFGTVSFTTRNERDVWNHTLQLRLSAAPPRLHR